MSPERVEPHVHPRHMNADVRLRQQVRLVLELSVRLVRVLYELDPMTIKPDPVDVQELINAMPVWGRWVTSMTTSRMRSTSCSILLKGHFLLHVCYLSSFLSPAVAWCYKGEDFMGKIWPLAATCAKGSQTWQVSGKMV